MLVYLKKKMKKTTLTAKVSHNILSRIKIFCKKRGINYSFFVEKALEEHLEREELKEDLLDLKTFRGQEKDAVTFEEYLEKHHV